MLRRVGRMLLREFIQILRDRRLRVLPVLSPLVQLVVYGYAINFDIKHIRTAVIDEDRTPILRELIDRLANTEYFDLRHYLNQESQARELIDLGELSLLLRIPRATSPRTSRPTRPPACN